VPRLRRAAHAGAGPAGCALAREGVAQQDAGRSTRNGARCLLFDRSNGRSIPRPAGQPRGRKGGPSVARWACPPFALVSNPRRGRWLAGRALRGALTLTRRDGARTHAPMAPSPGRLTDSAPHADTVRRMADQGPRLTDLLDRHGTFRGTYAEVARHLGCEALDNASRAAIMQRLDRESLVAEPSPNIYGITGTTPVRLRHGTGHSPSSTARLSAKARRSGFSCRRRRRYHRQRRRGGWIRTCNLWVLRSPGAFCGASCRIR
jgi:hypothetical protein